MKIFILTLIAFFFQFMPAKPTRDISKLKSTIDSIITAHKGNFAVSFKDLTNENRLDINAHDIYHAASTMKTPVMIEVFNQVQQCKFLLDDSVLVVNSFKSIIDGSEYSLSLTDDSEDGLYNRIGMYETIRNLVFKMITASSNLATNILIEKIGPENVAKTLSAMGLNDIKVLRGVEDGKAFEAGRNNITTSFDLSIIFETIALKKCVSKQSSEEMLQILLSQKFKDMIPAKLPTTVKVAHKTGSITNVQHDSGIIYLPDGRSYVLVVLSKNLETNKEGIDAVALISRVIYDFMME